MVDFVRGRYERHHSTGKCGCCGGIPSGCFIPLLTKRREKRGKYPRINLSNGVNIFIFEKHSVVTMVGTRLGAESAESRESAE